MSLPPGPPDQRVWLRSAGVPRTVALGTRVGTIEMGTERMGTMPNSSSCSFRTRRTVRATAACVRLRQKAACPAAAA
eukprot:4532117-Pyramimonas_sp.AAC.1